MALIRINTAEEEMKKDPQLKQSDLDLLRDWLKKQPHLPPIPDYELILFLHSNYYRTEPTKITIDAFFTYKTHIPEFFSKRDPVGSKELRDVMKYSLPLPSTTPEGYKVVFAKLLDFEPSNYVFAESLKLLIMVMELMAHNEGPCPGYIVLTDMDGCRFGHLTCLNPTIIKKLVYFVQEAIPIRLKGVHFMNTVPFMDTILKMAKPFMKNEIMELLVCHNSTTTLSESIPIDILPNEQGGKAGPLKDLWAAHVKVIEDHREWFQQEEMRKVNEAARPGKAKNLTQISGVEGSFKKLDID